jgi:hypothetical protein
MLIFIKKTKLLFMKKINQLILISLLTTSFAAYSQNKTEIMVQQKDKERLKATVEKNYEYLETILAENLIYTHSNAFTEGKLSYINNLKSGSLIYLEIIPVEFTTKQYSKNIVINRGQLKLKVSNAQNVEQAFSLKFTDVYEKQKTGWKMISWQSTRIPN